MRRPWVLAFAPLLFSAPAFAQPLPLPVLQPVIVPLSQPGPLPNPIPVFPVPIPVPIPVYPAPPPISAPPPVYLPPPPASYAELPPPAPPPQKRDHGVLLAADLGVAWPVHSPDAKLAGVGLDFRVGYRFSLAGGLVWLAPEADLGWVDFPQYDWAVRLGAGGHLGLALGVVEPSIHAFGGGFANVWKQGPGLRAGGSLDFRPGRFVSPGIDVDWNQAGWNTGSVRYVSTGIHVGFIVGK